MATMIINISDNGDMKKIAEAVSMIKGIEKVALQGELFERIPDLPYIEEECIASVRRATEDYRANGVVFSMDEMRAKHPRA